MPEITVETIAVEPIMETNRIVRYKPGLFIIEFWMNVFKTMPK